MYISNKSSLLFDKILKISEYRENKVSTSIVFLTNDWNSLKSEYLTTIDLRYSSSKFSNPNLDKKHISLLLIDEYIYDLSFLIWWPSSLNFLRI